MKIDENEMADSDVDSSVPLQIVSMGCHRFCFIFFHLSPFLQFKAFKVIFVSK